MDKKIESFDTSSKNFIETMEQLVSNDKTIRENALPKLSEYLKYSYKNNIELYQKISRSLFYFFFNTDKPNYQLSMAKLISSLIFIKENKKENKILIPEHEIWIYTFLSEFEKKFKSIDVLRLDKYIMLIDQVISTYLVACLENKKFNSIINLINYFSREIKNNSNNYNFTFESNKIKIINRFINILFDKKIEIKNKTDFIFDKKNGFVLFIKTLLEFYLAISDKREIEFFNKNILDNLLNIISNIKKENINSELINNIKKEIEIFFDKNKNSLIKSKFSEIDFFIKKLKNENYQKEENIKNEIIEPVNDYIMNKKYKQKFRKSKTDVKKEKINKKEKEKNINKNKDKKIIKKNKNYSNEIIDFNNIEFEKEIVNLEKNEESEKQIKNNEMTDKDKSNKDQNILNKKTKRNKNKIKK